MCQKAEGESDYLVSLDRSIRLRGWEAFHKGVLLSENPEPTHPNQQYSHAYQWQLGWETAQAGRQPW